MGLDYCRNFKNAFLAEKFKKSKQIKVRYWENSMKQSEKKAWIQTMYLGELIPLLIGTGISVLGIQWKTLMYF